MPLFDFQLTVSALVPNNSVFVFNPNQFELRGYPFEPSVSPFDSVAPFVA